MPSPRNASAAIDSSSSTGTWQPSAAFRIQRVRACSHYGRRRVASPKWPCARREAEGGLAARRGFATKRMAISAATRRERLRPWCEQALQAQALESRRQPALERDRLRDLRLPLHLVPQLELQPLPDENDALVEARIAPQRR